jgi:hypothetical protein
MPAMTARVTLASTTITDATAVPTRSAEAVAVKGKKKETPAAAWAVAPRVKPTATPPAALELTAAAASSPAAIPAVATRPTPAAIPIRWDWFTYDAELSSE